MRLWLLIFGGPIVLFTENHLLTITFLIPQVLNYDYGGISIETRKGELTTSHLLIQNADETNSGKYSCSPSNAIVASIRVHVLNGKCKQSLSSISFVYLLWNFLFSKTFHKQIFIFSN